MPYNSTFANELAKLIFQNIDVPDIGDASGLQNSATEGSYYLALHTADPGAGNAQNSNECAYTGYARTQVQRNSSNWTVTNNVVTNTNVESFGEKTGGSDETATHWSIGVASSGATKILYRGALSANLTITNGVNPQIAAGACSVTFPTT